MRPTVIKKLKNALASEKRAHKLTQEKLEENLKLKDKLNNSFEFSPQMKSGYHCVTSNSCNTISGIFENLVDAYILINNTGDIVKLNKAASNLFGYTLEDQINVKNLLYIKDFKYAMKSYYKLYRNGTFSNFVARVHTKNKGIRHVHINSSIVYGNDKVPIGAQGIIRDITKEREDKRIFTEQNKQQAIIVDNSPLGIVLTIKGKIIKVNNTFANMIGYSEKELLKMTVRAISFTEEITKSSALIKKMEKGEIDNFNLVKKYKKKDGSQFISKTTVNSVMDDKGHSQYQVAMIEDITNEVHESSMLKAINNLLASIIGKNDIHEIAWEIAKRTIKFFGFEDCVIYILNKETNELEQIAAYGNKNPKEHEILNLIKIPLGQGIVGTVAKTGISELINDTSLDPRYIIDDKLRYSELTVPIIANGKVIGVIDSEHSTKNYFTKTHLETLNSIANLAALQLKGAISNKLHQEAKAQRDRLMTKLEKNNLELQEYAHIVSHDLKSPLRNVSALVSWIREDYENKMNTDGVKNLNLIDNTLEKMDKLISGILEYSSISKKNKKNTCQVNLSNVIAEVLESVYIPSNIKVKIIHPFPTLNSNKTKMQQLFQNLISNSALYIDKEKGLIELDYSESKKHFTFSIKDNGIGIEEKYFDKIFKVFQTLETQKKSTGIGLSIVKKIVNFYNGKIWIESEVGKGTCFYIKLPKN